MTCWFGSVVVALAFAGSAFAAEPSAPRADLDLPLPELPKAPSLATKTATPEQINRLQELLARITSAEVVVRENAVSELLEVTPDWLPAIERLLHQIADRRAAEEMKKVLTQIRSQARESEVKKHKARHERGKVQTPDYLAMLLEFARPNSAPWQDATRIVALSRMLVQVGTVEAARSLVNVYVRFGDFLRVDTQLQLDKLGDVAVATLIETERHASPKISNWAKHQLDLRHRALPSDAVSGADETALPEILRAYGRTKNPDAARIVVSLTNSERTQVRLAARQAISLMGATALWQLRDTYEDVVGHQAPRDWSWDRMARELFREFDRLRLARVHQLFREGLELRSKGQLSAMRKRFDQVVARNPNFEGAEQLAEGYLAYAEQTSEKEGLLAAARAERLATDPGLKKKATSLRLTLEAHALLARGIADTTLLESAIQLNPENQRAQALKQKFEQATPAPASASVRYAGAIAIALTALAALGVIVLRKHRREPASGKANPLAPQGDPPPET